MERVLGPSAVGDRVGQRLDHVEELQERARVGVREQQRLRVRDLGTDVDEVDGLPVDLGQEVRVGVDPGLDRTPVERLPALDHVAQVGHRRAVVPGVAGRRRRVPGPLQALAEVVEVGLRELDAEGADLGGVVVFMVLLLSRLT